MKKTELIAIPGKQEIFVKHIIDAPPQLVFKAYTDPDLLPQWWGPRYLTTSIDRMEVKQGGVWRFVQTDPQGNVYAFHGVYHEVSASERLVYTFEFEGMPGHVVLESVAFNENDGATYLTVQSVFQSVEDRDGMLREGMEQGEAESFERLAELLVKIR